MEKEDQNEFALASPDIQVEQVEQNKKCLNCTKKKLIIIISIIVSVLIIIAVVVVVLYYYFIGFPRCVGDKEYDYSNEEIHVEHDGINLYGRFLLPEGDELFPLVVYAHGAESDYKADMTTLKSLAMSGIAAYTFDFYGWSTRTKGPKSGDWFKESDKDTKAYENQVLEQVKDLDAVVNKVKTFGHIDVNNIYIIGSSMGGATTAASSVNHSNDVKAIILQYPAINLVPEAKVDNAELDVNKFINKVLILQGTSDKIVPLSMSQELLAHYNKYDNEHANMITYDGQPHVFTGPYKVRAAEDIYKFIKKLRE